MQRVKTLAQTLMIASAMSIALFAQGAGPLMDDIIGHYQKIQLSLASDSLAGVKTEAQAITQKAETLMKQDPSLNGANAIEFKKTLEEIRDGARKLDTDDINKARAGFADLSQPIVRYVKNSSAGKGKYYIAYCPMAKKSWVQAEKAIKNPYYGKSMLACGTIEKK